MKILMSSSENKNLLAPQYFEYFKSQGVELSGFHSNELLQNQLTHLVQKIYFKINPNHFYKACNVELLSQARAFEPDIILLFKGMSIFPETLISLKKMNIKLVNYNPDHPLVFESYQGNDHVVEAISLFDLYVSYSTNITKVITNNYPKVQTECIPFGFSISQKQFDLIENVAEIKRLCFIGTADKKRKAFIKELAMANIPIDVYGRGWKNFKVLKGDCNCYNGISGLDFWKRMRQYRVQLNLFRNQNIGAHNMRSFEIPAAGGIMLAPQSKDHEKYFKEGVEFFSFSKKDEAIEKAKWILDLSAKEVNEVRFNARKRSLNSDYSYSQRGAEFLKILRKII